MKGFLFKWCNLNENIRKKRLDICKVCTFRDGKWCGICGCVLDAKTRVKSEHCPKNLW